MKEGRQSTPLQKRIIVLFYALGCCAKLYYSVKYV